MRYALTGLFRGIFFLAVVAGLAAVALARLAPTPTEYRRLAGSSCVSISGYLFSTVDRSSQFLDPETGRAFRVEFPEDDYVDDATCSPWADDAGESQVVARWTSRTSIGLPLEGFGLARYAFPSGRTLDRVSLEVMPISRPCFVPGRTDRVIFAGGDGRLHALTFDEGGGAPARADREDDATCRPLTWQVSPPGDPVLIGDPVWPTSPKLGRRLLVTLITPDPTPGRQTLGCSQLWWLELDRAARTIVAAGRLSRGTPSSSPARPEREERLPNVLVAPDGRLVLGFLHRPEGQSGWNLGVAPIDIDPETGAPSIDPAAVRDVAGSRAPTLPAFSSDGRWVYSLARSGEQLRQIERHPLTELPATPAPATEGLASRPGPGKAAIAARRPPA